MSRRAQSPRQILRLPDERLRFRADGGRSGGRGLWRDRAPEDADLIILNTCHIREKAAEKVYSELGRIRVLKEARGAQGREVLIGVAGCVAQAEGEEIVAPRAGGRSRRRPAVLSPPARTDRASAPAARRVVETEFAVEDKFDDARAAPSASAIRQRGVAAFLTVQEGCDKFCTFCVVPYTRGAEVSRPVGADRRRGRAAGATPACASSRCSARTSTPITAKAATDAPGRSAGCFARSREIAGHRAAALHHQPSARHGRRPDRRASRSPTLMPYLHLPVQSGSDRILAAMNRRHTARRLSRLDRADPRRAAGYRASLRFHRRLSRRERGGFRGYAALVEEVGYAGAFSFKYSAAAGHAGGRASPTRSPRR